MEADWAGHSQEMIKDIYAGLFSCSFPDFETYVRNMDNINARDENGNHILSYTEDPIRACLILTLGGIPCEAYPSLLSSTSANDSNGVTRLLKTGVHPDVGIDQGRPSCLMIAATNGFVELVRLLIAYGADVNTKDADGETPLMWASSRGRLECVNEIIKSGADPNIRNTAGRTAIYWAIQYGHNDVCRILCKFGIDLFNIDKYGYSPLEYAKLMNSKLCKEVIDEYISMSTSDES